WSRSDVTVTWNWSDGSGGSRIDTANCATSSMSSGEVIGTLAATCTDKAGNTGSASVAVKVDKTAPQLTSTGPTVPASGWLTSAPATIEVQASDPSSVVDERSSASAGAGAGKVGPGSQLASERCSDTPNGGSPTSLFTDTLVQQTFLAYPQLTGDGSHVINCTMTDAAGNSTPQSLTVKIDTTAPTVTAAATSQPNGNGWYGGPVTVHFTCTDAAGGSGLAAYACPAVQVLSTEGTAVSSTAQTVADIAGNTSAPSNVATVKIERTPPTVQVTGVSDGANYTLGSVPQAGCSTTDGRSGVATQATVTLSGGNASGVGAFTATCGSGTDTRATPRQR
ncbi:MAG TPA: hypothetical protein VFD32_03365, partial [Dehalococcoidia bacterium]|nr:hypothetical protein [Dehalococcoidia bacterium]